MLEADEIGGTVTSSAGPEAGVWVIVETEELTTVFSKTVVTDDQGRYLIPELPSATYDIWVRGYGLVDSEKRRVTPGRAQDLEAVIAPDAHAAAQYYPAGHWFSLIEVPDESEFPGTGAAGNGISPNFPTNSRGSGASNPAGAWRAMRLETKRPARSPPSWENSRQASPRGSGACSLDRPVAA
jgi:hypothetical protein